MNIIKQILPLFGLIFLFSCEPRKNLNYMQDIEKIVLENAHKLQQTTLQPGDELVIMVMAKDADVAAPFNQSYSSGKALQNLNITGNVQNISQTASGPTYIVDDEGAIDMPILGKINVKGLTIDGLKSTLYNKLRRYIKEPSVSVRLNNFKVSVMGEVTRPGEYILTDGKGTLMQALSLAGDLTIYGLRDEVLLIRTTEGRVEQTKIDLSKADFINSPYYILKQGDVIYVPANKTRQKASRLDPNAGIYISVASVIIGLLALFIRK